MDSAGLPSGVFPDQGWNSRPLLWQGVESLPLSRQESPQAILDSSFPRSYLVREAWELAVLSHSLCHHRLCHQKHRGLWQAPAPPSVVSDPLQPRGP